MFDRFVSKLTGFLSSQKKEPTSLVSVPVVPVAPPVLSRVAVEDQGSAPLHHGRNRSAERTRNRDELRALRGTSNKGARRMALYAALEG